MSFFHLIICKGEIKQLERDNKNVFQANTFVLKEPNFGRRRSAVLFEHFAQVILCETGRRVVEV